MRFVLLGDWFEDVYHVGKVRGQSAEAPIPILDITSTLTFNGGVGNVRANLVSLLQSEEHQVHYIYTPGNNHPQKHRLIADLVTGDKTQIARWDENDWVREYDLDRLGWIEHYSDVVIVSDYGKGSITPKVIDQIKSCNKPTLVDTKQDPIYWLGANVTLFPNEKEYNQFKSSYNQFPRVIRKRSENGLSRMKGSFVICTDPILPHPNGVVNVNGAGDTVIAAWAACLTPEIDSWCGKYLRGVHMEELRLKFCNAAASVVCSKPYTAVATLDEIESLIV